MQLNDYLCPKCENIERDVLCNRTEAQICPICYTEMLVKVSVPTGPHPIRIEDYVESKRGHLGFKIKKSLEKERKMKQIIQQKRRVADKKAAELGIRISKGKGKSKSVSADSLKFGGRKV